MRDGSELLYCPDCESGLRQYKLTDKYDEDCVEPYWTVEDFTYHCGYHLRHARDDSSDELRTIVLKSCGPDYNILTLAQVEKIYGSELASDLASGILDAISNKEL